MTNQHAELVVADGLGLRTKHGPVFADLHFAWPAGVVTAVTGPAGAGRSSLLLASCGRMRGLTGRLTVAGIDAIERSHEIRAVTSVARIAGLVELEGQLTVAECITERALIDAVAPQQAEAEFTRLERAVGIDLPRTLLVDELPALDQTVAAVILATVRPSRLIVLDDADARIDLADQRRLFAALRTMCAITGATIAVSATETAALPDDVPRIELSRPPRQPAPPLIELAASEPVIAGPDADNSDAKD